MQLEEIIKDLKNIKPKNPKIRDWGRIWNPFMVKYDCQYVCEIGVYKGGNFMEMIRHSPKLAVAIDSWKDDGVHPRESDDYTQTEFDEQYNFFKKRVADKPFVRVIRDYSFNAAKEFPNNYFDFIYIDADHSFEGCYSDLTDWYPKVKHSKFLLGHDYSGRYSGGVVKAVDKFVREENLDLILLFPSTWAVIKK